MERKNRQNPLVCMAPKTPKLKWFSSLPKGWSPITPNASNAMNHCAVHCWILGFWQVPIIAVGMQSTQKCLEMLCLF